MANETRGQKLRNWTGNRARTLAQEARAGMGNLITYLPRLALNLPLKALESGLHYIAVLSSIVTLTGGNTCYRKVDAAWNNFGKPAYEVIRSIPSGQIDVSINIAGNKLWAVGGNVRQNLTDLIDDIPGVEIPESVKGHEGTDYRPVIGLVLGYLIPYGIGKLGVRYGRKRLTRINGWIW